MTPGRSCPPHYRYGAEALAGEPALEAEALIVAGGLYGNPEALACVEALADAERATLVFNGDFHWFDIEPEVFADVQARVLRHPAIAGNVEAELAEPSGAGCGCAYPETVDDATVARSNAIIARLRETVDAGQRHALARLPFHLGARVGEHRIAIVHGDPDSLAGWGLAVESIGRNRGDAAARERLEGWFRSAGVDVFASTHTCLPHALTTPVDGHTRVVINNGSAGMPNFAGDRRGLVTRIATTPSRRALYRTTLPGLFLEAIPLPFDTARWDRRFQNWWPAGSAARLSYARRIAEGPRFELANALGSGVVTTI